MLTNIIIICVECDGLGYNSLSDCSVKSSAGFVGGGVRGTVRLRPTGQLGADPHQTVKNRLGVE